MRLLFLAPIGLLLLNGAAFAKDQPSAAAAPETLVHHHRSHAARLKAEAKAVAAEDSESRIGQVPVGVLGPPGERIPEAGPQAPKTEGTSTPAKANTADCTGANANSKECYSATQQNRGK
jgi:hypothetical protein